MRKKFPLYGSWLLSLTLIFGMSTPISAQAESKTTAQVEAVQAKRQAVNSNIGISDRSSNRPMAFPDPYCGPLNYSVVEPITYVEIADLKNRTDNILDGSPAHEDFTFVTGELEQGVTYEIILEGNTAGEYVNHFAVFIDWNQNGILDDEGEVYLIDQVLFNSTGADGNQIFGEIKVPEDAVLGNTRMRVKKHYHVVVTDPCGLDNSPFGQAEDYTINVTAESGGGTEYCIPEGMTSTRLIENFSTTGGIQNISNISSGFSDGGYGNFYNIHTVGQKRGEDVSFSVDIERDVAGFRIWVDWNQDGVFDTTEEVAYFSTDYQMSHSGSINVPEDALVGDTRMRIVSHTASDTGDVNPCETGFVYGEFEDYKFRVVGSGIGGNCTLISTGVFEEGRSFTKNLGRIVAHDVIVPADQNMLLEKINLNAFIGSLGSGVSAQDVDIYIYEDNEGMPGTLVAMIPDVVPTSQTIIGDAFGFQVYDVEIDFTAVELDGQEGIETTYWIGASLDATDGSNVFWEFYSDTTAPVVGYGLAYDDGVAGFIIELENEGVYTFHATCTDVEFSGDCGQGDDSNEFQNGFNINANGRFRNADDFFVSPEQTLDVFTIELNILAHAPIDSININFFEDDHGAPGNTIVDSVSGLVPYDQIVIGENLGFTIYAVYVEVDLSFEGGPSGTSYWMQPEAVSSLAYWEVTSLGMLGEPIHTSENSGVWIPDENAHHAVFKLHCYLVDPHCMFDITVKVEPITRVQIADIDKSSSPLVNGSPALQDFTHVKGHVLQDSAYDIALEGNTDGPWTNYFTIWIDWNKNGEWEADEMYEIGSINDSTGDDGKQAIGTISVPADAVVGKTIMRVIKNYNSSPTDPCGQYSYGQAEDYTIIIDGDIGVEDQSSTSFIYYPNPTSDILNIVANKKINYLSVVNVLGQKVITENYLDNGQINLSTLRTGTYMFRVIFEDGSMETFKVLKK